MCKRVINAQFKKKLTMNKYFNIIIDLFPRFVRTYNKNSQFRAPVINLPVIHDINILRYCIILIITQKYIFLMYTNAPVLFIIIINF